ncbi:MAG TPA: hypothetical protein VGD02_12500, partial [Gemmatimonadaceae bacterium]
MKFVRLHLQPDSYASATFHLVQLQLKKPRTVSRAGRIPLRSQTLVLLRLIDVIPDDTTQYR